MALPKSPSQLTRAESWPWTIQQLERSLLRPFGRDLRPLIDLTRQIGSSTYGHSYRAGTHLLETLVISTALQYGLGTDEPYITVSIERQKSSPLGFCILYNAGGDDNEDVQALLKTYGTDDFGLIMSNLRRDLAGYYYPCEFSEGWETLQPLMVRLWNETHPNGKRPIP